MNLELISVSVKVKNKRIKCKSSFYNLTNNSNIQTWIQTYWKACKINVSKIRNKDPNNRKKKFEISYIVYINPSTLMARLLQGLDMYPESSILPSLMFNSWRAVETSIPTVLFNSAKGEGEEIVRRSSSSLQIEWNM